MSEVATAAAKIPHRQSGGQAVVAVDERDRDQREKRDGVTPVHFTQLTLDSLTIMR